MIDMRKLLLLLASAACASAATGSEPALCDSKPFTLNKPAPTAQKPATPSKVADAVPKKPIAKAKPAAKPAPKPRLISTCKSGEKKPG